jgi:hypothetical protein
VNTRGTEGVGQNALRWLSILIAMSRLVHPLEGLTERSLALFLTIHGRSAGGLRLLE